MTPTNDELLRLILDIDSKVQAVKRLLAEKPRELATAPDRPAAATPRKNRVSDGTYFATAPTMVELLLREGCKTVGMRTPSLASELSTSKATVLGIARRAADETGGLVYLVPYSERGGRGTIIKITGRRFEEAKAWAQDVRSRAVDDTR